MDMAIDKMIGLPEAQIEDLRNLMEDWKNELLVYKFALDQMDTMYLFAASVMLSSRRSLSCILWSLLGSKS